MERKHCFRQPLNRIIRPAIPVVLAFFLITAFSLFLEAETGRGAANAELLVCKTDPSCDFSSLQDAISAASNGDTILVRSGEYTEAGKIIITKNLTITAEDASTKPVLKPSENTGDNSNDDRAWIIVRSGVTFNLRNVILDGSGREIIEAIQSFGSGTIEGNEFRHFQYQLHPSLPDLYNSGTAIMLRVGDTMVSNNTFTDIGRVGALACGQDASMTFEGNTYYGKSAIDRLDVAAWVAGGAKATIEHNTVYSNTGTDSGVGLSSAAIRVDSFSLMCQQDKASSATITSNSLLDSKVGILVGASDTDTSSVVANFNRIVGNETGVRGSNIDVPQDARYNWWGCNAGPVDVDCDKVVGDINATNHLRLVVSAAPQTIKIGEQSTITASITSSVGHVPDGTPVSFDTDLGSIQPSAVLSGGSASALFSAGNTPGTATITARVDNQEVSATISVNQKTYFTYLSTIEQKYSRFVNGDFEDGLYDWEHGQGPFIVDRGPHGSGLPQSVVSQGSNNNAALLGNPNFTDGSIPVGYGFIAQTFTVDKTSLSLEYHLMTFDIAEGANGYYDTFEVSVNRPPSQITDAERNAIGCKTPDDAPTGVTVTSDGLVLCTGGSGEPGAEKDYNTKTLVLNLDAFQGKNVTVYFAVWSREYGSTYYDDRAFYNTWVTIDNVQLQ